MKNKVSKFENFVIKRFVGVKYIKSFLAAQYLSSLKY